MKAQTASIIGITRAGVSVAMALKASSAGLTLVGHDANRDRLEEVRSLPDAFDKLEWNLIEAIAAADIIILDVPIAELETTLSAIGSDVQPHAVLLDFSVLKSPGLKLAARHLQGGHYIGASPVPAVAYLADGRDDPRLAAADFFYNGSLALMPSVSAEPAAVETAVNFGRLLGATPYFVDAMEYDSLVQGVETVPALLAAAMFGAVHGSTGWRDILRFAGRPFGTATQALNQGTDIVPLALHDRAGTLRWLDALMSELGRWRTAIDGGDSDLLELMAGDAVLKQAKWLKDRDENNWVEVSGQPIETPTFTEQMLGSWIGGKNRKGNGTR